MRKLILVGDPTDHGGKVISGTPTTTFHDKPVARKGDLVECPEKYPDNSPHGINPILEGEPHMPIDGSPVALEGHKTACGCALIATIGAPVDFDGIDLPSLPLVNLILNAGLNPTDFGHVFDRRFQIIDDETGKPAANRPYKLASAVHTLEGRTDSNGLTENVYANSAAVVIHVSIGA